MDSQQFDALARRLAGRISRRAFLAAAASTLVGAAPSAIAADVCRTPGEACGRAADGAKCCRNATCDSRRGVCAGRAGAACTERSQCQTNFTCREGVCGNPARLSQACAVDGDCIATLVCDAGVCLNPPGARCTSNATCANDLVCRGSKCVDPGMPGDTCDEVGDCLPNMTCARRKCVAGIGAACVRNAQCPTQSICRTLPDDRKVCGRVGCSDIDCGGPLCPQCTSGRFCDVDLDCESGDCDGGICV